MKIIENFLEKNEYLKLKELIFNVDFPWRIRNNMVGNDGAYYFTHNFFNNFLISSEYFRDYIIPIMQRLNAKAIVQVRANLILSKLFEKSDLHIDNTNDFKCKTAILNFTTCDGGTELLIKDKLKFIKSEENKIIIFDQNVRHRSITSQKTSARVILNMNYFD
jgi:hypothetical protein